MFNRDSIKSFSHVFAVASDCVIPFVVWACWLSGQHIFKADLLSGLQRSLCTNKIQLPFTGTMITFQYIGQELLPVTVSQPGVYANVVQPL